MADHLERMDAEVVEGMEMNHMEIKYVEELIGKDADAYSAVYAVNSV